MICYVRHLEHKIWKIKTNEKKILQNVTVVNISVVTTMIFFHFPKKFKCNYTVLKTKYDFMDIIRANMLP